MNVAVHERHARLVSMRASVVQIILTEVQTQPGSRNRCVEPHKRSAIQRYVCMDDQPADLLDPNSARTRFNGKKISATANFAPHAPLGNLALNGEWVINRYSTRA
jgi:hypothetical protein